MSDELVPSVLVEEEPTKEVVAADTLPDDEVQVWQSLSGKWYWTREHDEVPDLSVAMSGIDYDSYEECAQVAGELNKQREGHNLVIVNKGRV